MRGQHIYIGHYKNEENDLFLQFVLGNYRINIVYSIRSVLENIKYIKCIFALVVKQDRKARQVIAFLPVSKARTNNFYIFRQFTYLINIWTSLKGNDSTVSYENMMNVIFRWHNYCSGLPYWNRDVFIGWTDLTFRTKTLNSLLKVTGMVSPSGASAFIPRFSVGLVLLNL
jgi:hypothetical protein